MTFLLVNLPQMFTSANDLARVSGLYVTCASVVPPAQAS